MKLVVVYTAGGPGLEEGQEFPIKRIGSTTIGREAGNDIILPQIHGGHIDRQLGVFKRGLRGITYRDLGSQKGTLVTRGKDYRFIKPLRGEEIKLEKGDQLRLGGVTGIIVKLQD